jgi:serine/threonine protein kinase
MATSGTQLAGTILQEFILEDLIGEGGYSWIYKGINKDLINRRAFKIAKPADLVGQRPTTGYGSRALIYVTGGTVDVSVDTSQLLSLQSNRMMDAADTSLVSIEEFGIERGLSFCRMEILEGQTLRNMIDAGPVPVSLFLNLAQSMQRLAANKKFLYHGDLKPENIMVTAGGIKILDAGYFGPIDTKNGEVDKCMVTTPEYYPHLTPDDLYALGIMIWEAACRVHPLSAGGDSTYSDMSKIGPDLKSWVRHREMVGQYFLSPILECGRPADVRPGLPEDVEQLCLRGLHLRVDNEGKLDRGPGFASFDELISALRDLMDKNIRQL